MLKKHGVIVNIGKIILPEVNKTYNNIDTENSIYWEIEPNPLHEVISMETNWQKKRELLNNEIVESSSVQTYLKVQMIVEENILALKK